MAVTDSMQKKILMGIIVVLVIVGGIYFVGNNGAKTPQISSNGVEELRKGRALAKEGKVQEALDMYEKAAERGNLSAMNAAGWYLTRGRDGISKDVAKGVSYLTKAADAGLADAAYNLGKVYMDPLPGVKRDFEKGIKYISQAAEKGHGLAIYFLGIYYEIGRGVEKDTAKALELYDKAAATTRLKNIKARAESRAARLRAAGVN